MTGHRVNCLFIIGCILLAGMAASCGSRQVVPYSEKIQVRQMSGFPLGEPGFDQGVSACFAGIYDGQLLLTGGCNFPETPAAEGGKKRFYKNIYATDVASDSVFAWRKVGELPEPVAYGVSVSTPLGLICVGGTNGDNALTSVYRISISDAPQAARIETLPPLPFAIDNMGGAVVDNTLLIAGGNVNGIPSNRLFCLNLGDPATGWQELPSFPGAARVQPVCVGQQKNGEMLLYLWGGFAGAFAEHPATLSVDGYCFSLATQQWKPVATPAVNDSTTISLGGGMGIAVSDSLILCTGGVNKDVFLTALKREEALKTAVANDDQCEIHRLKTIGKEYMLWPARQYRFNDRILIYNTRRDHWEEVFRHPGMSRAGAVMVGKGNTFFSINGELKPGIRTPEINKITIN